VLGVEVVIGDPAKATAPRPAARVWTMAETLYLI
jgi:hypothetical protein